MKKTRRWLVPLIAVGMIGISSAAVMADEETRDEIKEVPLHISSNIEVRDTGSDIEVTTDSNVCNVGTVDVDNEPNGEWKHKDKPKVKVRLEAENGYYFKSGFDKKNISLTGSKGKVSSVKRKNSDEIQVFIKLNSIKADDGDFELDIDEAEWNPWNAYAVWDECEDAKYYEVRLYRNGNLPGSVKSFLSANYDFSPYVTTAGKYVFEVRGVYDSNRKGDWEESEPWQVSWEKVSELMTMSANKTGQNQTQGTWIQNEIGWWYCNPDRSYTRSNWQFINGIWYFFNEEGYMKTGWTFWNGKWYFLNEKGEMLKNAIAPDGKQVGEDGAWVQ